MTNQTDLVTGPWSYSGQVIAEVLIERGRTVRGLTSRSAPDPDPHNGRIRVFRYGQFADHELEAAFDSVDTFYNTFWTRHAQAPLGHSGAWMSHGRAVDCSRALIRAARSARVRRIVHLSIANPTGPWPYYRGKAEVEQAVIESGIPYAILRPACFFGYGGILLENISWAVRRMPVFPVPRGPDGTAGYPIRPIHVRDLAESAVRYGQTEQNIVRDACGPEQYRFDDLIRALGQILNGRPKRIWALSPDRCERLYGLASRILGETILTRDEIEGLAVGKLGSDREPLGHTRLSEWTRDHRDTIGRRFIREPARSSPGVDGC